MMRLVNLVILVNKPLLAKYEASQSSKWVSCQFRTVAITTSTVKQRPSGFLRVSESLGNQVLSIRRKSYGKTGTSLRVGRYRR